jgi:hypothetical protein
MKMLWGFVNSGEVVCTKDSRMVFGAQLTVYETGRKLRKAKVMKKVKVWETGAGKCLEGVLKEGLHEGAVQIQ